MRKKNKVEIIGWRPPKEPLMERNGMLLPLPILPSGNLIVTDPKGDLADVPGSLGGVIEITGKELEFLQDREEETICERE